MKKYLKKGLCAITAAVMMTSATQLTSVIAADSDPTFGVFTYRTLEDGTVAIISCDQSVTSIEIPSEIDGKPVTALGNTSFWWCDKLTELTIPDSVKYIYSNTFYSCLSLSEVTLGSGVEYLGLAAFNNCSSLTSITIPQNVTYIDCDAFFNCTSLEEIIIEDGVEYIGDSAFQNCTALSSVDLGDSLEFLGYSAFNGCTALEELSLPDTLTELSNFTFNNCTSLNKISLPDALISIGNSCFKGCSLLNEIDIPLSTQSIGYDAFLGTPLNETPEQGPVIIDGWIVGYNGRALNENQYFTIDDSIIGIADNALCSEDFTTVHIGSGVKYIGNEAFARCSLITEIEFTGNVVSIGTAAFSDCTKLEQINIPDSVSYVGQYAFYRTGYYNNCEDGVVYLEDWAVDYKGEMPENTSLTIKDGTYGISAGAFASNTNLSEIIMPDGVAVIGEEAFWNCTSLKSVSLPETLEIIYNDAFCNCTSLTEIEIPANVMYMGDTSVGFIFDSIQRKYNPFEEFTIKGWTNSLAELYATVYGFNFISLGEAEYSYYLLGDINVNGKIDIGDAIILQKYLLGTISLDSEQLLRADINEDNSVDIFDNIYLKQFLTFSVS